MHAILGMAASDLMQHDTSLVAAAMAHRVKAIKAIKKTLTDVPKANTFEEGNALLATCYALTFQSVSLDDGMAEYMTFIRGIIIVAIQMFLKGARILFRDFIGDDQLELVKPHMEHLPLINPAWSDAATAAVRGLAPLCTGAVEHGYYELLLQIVESLSVSSFEGTPKIWILLIHLISFHLFLFSCFFLSLFFFLFPFFLSFFLKFLFIYTNKGRQNQLTKVSRATTRGGCSFRTTSSNRWWTRRIRSSSSWPRTG